MPQRSRKVVLVAHCHLNVNTKVHGLASYEGVRSDLIGPYMELGCGIIQLPCPEATYLGMRRWGMTREQYETPAFRRHCAEIARPVIDTVRALVDDDVLVEAIVGVDGSPSCGVNQTCIGYAGGELDGLFAGGIRPAVRNLNGFGVFMDVLRSEFAQAGLGVQFRGVSEDARPRASRDEEEN